MAYADWNTSLFGPKLGINGTVTPNGMPSALRRGQMAFNGGTGAIDIDASRANGSFGTHNATMGATPSSAVGFGETSPNAIIPMGAQNQKTAYQGYLDNVPRPPADLGSRAGVYNGPNSVQANGGYYVPPNMQGRDPMNPRNAVLAAYNQPPPPQAPPQQGPMPMQTQPAVQPSMNTKSNQAR